MSRAVAAVSTLALAGSAFAMPPLSVSADVKGGVATVSIPAHAVEIAPSIFSLGTAVHDGKVVEGRMFVYRKENAKPDNPGGGKGGKDKGGSGSKCYAHLAKGAKWKNIEPWVINPANAHGLSSSFLLSSTSDSFQEWEDAAGVNIIGNGSLTNATLVADQVSPDGFNEIYFGSIANPGVIAITITWGIYGGPPSGRKLVEMDQVFNQDFTWNNDGSPNDMDYKNISAHEIGHGLGEGHPTDDCTEETMYRFASEGETKKRDLNAGDIAGISDLY